MAAMRKLHRSVVWSGQSPVRAVHVGRGEIVWQDRCDEANGTEPRAAGVRFHPVDKLNAHPLRGYRHELTRDTIYALTEEFGHGIQKFLAGLLQGFIVEAFYS